MAKSSAAPLLIGGAAALFFLSGSKKKSSGSKSKPTGPVYGPGFNNPDPMAPNYPGSGGQKPAPAPKPKPSNDKDMWLERQEELVTLGYEEVGETDGVPGANTVAAIKLFQVDWNSFSDYLHNKFPDNDYQSIYSKTSVDGKWGPATEDRVDKAIGRFSGHEMVFVEDIGKEVRTFREMVNALKQL